MVTGFYAGVLALLYFYISLTVIKERKSRRIAYGGGANNEIQGIVSAHANFAAYVPLFLILILSIELAKVIPTPVLYVLGSVFTLGRFVHCYALLKCEPKKNFKIRPVGMVLTLFPTVAAALLAIASFALSQA